VQSITVRSIGIYLIHTILFQNFGKNNEGQFDERLINHFLNELKSLFKGNTFPLILFCSSNDKDIPIELKRLFLKTFEIKAPNEQERESILWWIIKTNEIKTDVDLNNIANKTHGFFFEDLRTLVLHAVTEFHNNHNNTKSNLPEHYFLQAVGMVHKIRIQIKYIIFHFRINAVKLQ
jgi:AAA+ superfamily predicted ATPase